MAESYDYHLNFEALHKSTETLEKLLNKYGQENKYVEEVYQSLKPLFNKIHSNKLVKAIEGNLIAGRLMSDTGLDEQYPDLRSAYSNFSWDIKGLTDAPLNYTLQEMYEKAKVKALAKKTAQEGK